jgi:hypothetical protein
VLPPSALQHVSVSPTTIGDIVKAALALTQITYKIGNHLEVADKTSVLGYV